jgi:hypothetical protein
VTRRDCDSVNLVRHLRVHYSHLINIYLRRHYVRKRAIGAGIVAAGSGIAIAMLAITPAVAGPVVVKGITTQVVSTTVTAAGNETAEADATCPAGELVLGGGYTVSGSATDWRIYLDAPINNSTWTVEPINFDANPLTFTSYAICAMDGPGSTAISHYTTNIVDANVTVATNETGEADATCPTGQLRTGGGYDVYNVSPNWSIYSNAPLGTDTWNVEIDNEVPLTTTFDSFAVCLAKVDSTPITKLTVSTVDTAGTAPASGTQAIDVSCGPNSLMTGGGHVIDSVGQTWSIQKSAPISANDWRVKATDTDNVSRDFDALAVCLAKV